MATKADRVEEKQLLETLHEEGLIERPIARAAFGISFEVMTDVAGPARRLPPRLASIELRQKKKKAMTEDEIRQKLERAERRRKVGCNVPSELHSLCCSG